MNELGAKNQTDFRSDSEFEEGAYVNLRDSNESSQLISRSAENWIAKRNYTNPNHAGVVEVDSDPEYAIIGRGSSVSHDPKQNINGVQLRLLNNGSVARDHLASERTYLAYVRTSLGISSAGVALMQFLHLGPTTKAFASFVGAAMVITGLVVLLIGTRRFFLVQRTLVTGHYPPSMAEMVAISLILGSIMIAIFAIVISRSNY